MFQLKAHDCPQSVGTGHVFEGIHFTAGPSLCRETTPVSISFRGVKFLVSRSAMRR
jgi:hypothetical protein